MGIWEIGMLAAAAVAMAILGSAYVRRKYRTGDKELGYKASATLMAVIPAVLLAVREGSGPAACMAAGAVCCMAADVLLELWFYAGAAVFAAGHICFISGFGLWECPGVFTAGLAAALGGIAFMISDMVLAQNLLDGKQSRRRDEIVLGFYYSAVYLLSVCRY